MGRQDRLVRSVVDEETITFAIVRERRSTDTRTLSYSQEARVSLARAFGTLSTDNPQHEVVQSVLTRFSRLRDQHGADDVRRTITRTLASFNAVTLRESSGIYWTPAPYAKQVRQLQSCIEQFGQSQVYLLPVHDSADASRTLGDVATQALQEELESLKTEVAAFVAHPPEHPTALAVGSTPSRRCAAGRRFTATSSACR